MPHFSEDGNVLGVFAMIEDITDKKNAEEELKESEEKFRLFFEGSSDSIFIFDEGDNIIDVNETASKVFGYSRDELDR